MPAYNVPDWPYGAVPEDGDADFLVVDDGSTNDCASMFSALGFEVVSLGRNGGLSEAMRIGFELGLERGYGRFVTIDGDGQHDPSHIRAFDEILSTGGVDVLTGNRFAYFEDFPPSKIAANSLVSLLVEERYGVLIPDPLCGFRGYSRCFVERFLDRGLLENYGMVAGSIFFALDEGLRVGWSPVVPVYFDGDPLTTKLSEISSLRDACSEYGFSPARLSELDRILGLGSGEAVSMRIGGIAYEVRRNATPDCTISCDAGDVRARYGGV